MAGPSKALSFALPQPRGPGAASSRPAHRALRLTPGTAQSLKHPLQQEARCCQSQGKEDHHLKSLCHLTGKPKSSPRSHPCLQSIPTGRRAGHSCRLSTPRCCEATRGPALTGRGALKDPLECIQIPHKPYPLAEQGAAGARLTSTASHRAGEDPKGSCDGHRDSQNKTAMMSHGGSPAWPARFTCPGGVTAQGPCQVHAANLTAQLLVQHVTAAGLAWQRCWERSSVLCTGKSSSSPQAQLWLLVG